MKIFILSEYNKYTSIGGTENYVDGLINGLLKLGNDVIFITQGETDALRVESIISDNTRNLFKVYFLPKIKYSAQEIRGQVVSTNWVFVSDLILEYNPDVFHIHTLSTFFNFCHIAKVCKVFKKRVFLTFHVPSHFCVQGDMIKNKKIPCDGVINFQCVVCKFRSGIKSGFSNLLNGYHLDKLGQIDFINENRINIICVSDWQKKHIISNGLNPILVSVIRQFLNNEDVMTVHHDISRENSSCKFRIGYLGRFSREKGSDLLRLLAEYVSSNDEIELILGCPIISDKRMLDLLNNSENIYWRNDINGDKVFPSGITLFSILILSEIIFFIPTMG